MQAWQAIPINIKLNIYKNTIFLIINVGMTNKNVIFARILILTHY